MENRVSSRPKSSGFTGLSGLCANLALAGYKKKQIHFQNLQRKIYSWCSLLIKLNITVKGVPKVTEYQIEVSFEIFALENQFWYF